MKLLAIASLALAASYVAAECNNMCSGHGTCGANDACSCYRNWRGNDCSERTCQFGVAFVDTAQGDLNHNGKIDLPSVGVTTQWAPQATFEERFNFPSNHEAHAYMECSNKGLCDRSSGECVCFDGYEGSACQRTVCPNSCNGHGVCRNMVDKTRALSSTAAHDYQLWDGLKNQACVCDPGYSGVDCSERLCPKGADPLLDEIEVSANTWQAVQNEVQGVDIGTTSAAVIDGSSTYALKYTDVFGEVWKTGSIVAKAATGAGGAAAVKAALEAIPNSVIESVTVTEAATAVGTGVEGVLYQVTFTHNPGNLNALEVVDKNWANAASAVTEITAGTTVATECSGRGLCDYETGVCKCFRGYRLDDCSSQHALAFGSSGGL